MNTNITIDKKREFIRWFLNSHQFRKRECVWILNFYLNNEEYLDKLHFVEDASLYQRGMRMATYCVDKPAFSYYENKSMITDPEKVFHAIKLLSDKDFYIELQFHNANKCLEYIEVLEGSSNIDEEIDQEIVTYAEKVMNESLEKFKRERLYDEINKALDNRNEKLFMELTNKLS